MMGKIRLMVVDDSPFIHKAVKRALPPEDYEIIGCAENGKDGSEKYFELKPDIVLMDITMPVMDGLEAAQAILGKDPSAKIVMLSAMGDDELIEKAKGFGVKEFMQKPFDPQLIKNVLSSVAGGLS